MRIELAGHVRIEEGDRVLEEAELPGRQGRLVLARLAFAAEPVHRDVLADTLWPSGPPSTWERTLSGVISRLRSGFTSAGFDDLMIANAFGCYELQAASDLVVDVREAVGCAETAERLVCAGDIAGARAAAAAAADIARHPLLAGEEAEWIETERTMLRDVLVRALNVVAEASVGSAEAVAAASEAIQIEPFRESSHVLLMRAHAALGNTAEALRIYERCKQVLADELGVDPSRQAQDAYLWILRESPADVLVDQLPEHSVPVPRTPLVGRDAELQTLTTLLSSPGLVTLTGTGGAGKTRLACEAALRSLIRFSRSAWFVDLSGVREPDLVPVAVADALGGPDPSSGTDVTSFVAGELGPDLLLVLDNCEHVLDECSRFVRTVLQAAPDSRILATSREPLRVAGERTFVVEPLSVPAPDETEPDRLRNLPAVQLFCARAARARPDFELTVGNAAAIGRICRRLDGLPLAIELAAARTAVLSAEQIDERLEDRFALLRTTDDAVAERHRTLETAISWSVELLTDAQRALWTRLAALPGGCPIDAVEDVCSGADIRREDVLDIVQELVERGLVGARERSGVTRYRLLESVREHAARSLGPDDPVHDRLFDWCMGLAAASGLPSATVRPPVSFDRLEDELDNIRAALSHASRSRTSSALALAGELCDFWMYRDHVLEGRRWLDASLAAERTPSKERLRALRTASTLARAQGDLRGSADHATERLRVARDVGGDVRIANAAHSLAVALTRLHDHDRATELLEEARTLYELNDERDGVANVLLALGQSAYDHGDSDAAITPLLDALSVYREIAHREGEATCLVSLAEAEWHSCRYEATRTYATEALAVYDELGHRGHTIGPLILLADCERNAGRLVGALGLADEAVVLAGELDRTYLLSSALPVRARIHFESSACRAAADDWLAAAKVAHMQTDDALEAACLAGAAHARATSGDVYTAVKLCESGRAGRTRGAARARAGVGRPSACRRRRPARSDNARRGCPRRHDQRGRPHAALRRTRSGLACDRRSSVGGTCVHASTRTRRRDRQPAVCRAGGDRGHRARRWLGSGAGFDRADASVDRRPVRSGTHVRRVVGRAARRGLDRGLRDDPRRRADAPRVDRDAGAVRLAGRHRGRCAAAVQRRRPCRDRRCAGERTNDDAVRSACARGYDVRARHAGGARRTLTDDSGWHDDVH